MALKICESIQYTVLSHEFHEKVWYDATLDPTKSPHVEGGQEYKALLSQDAYDALQSLQKSNSSTKTLLEQYPALRKAIEHNSGQSQTLSKPSGRVRSPSSQGSRDFR